MTCYSPLTAYKSAEVNPSGKRSLVFSLSGAYSGVPVRVPCGQCIGCRLERARQWAVRCVHEKRMHKRDAFITLTYDDAHLPRDGSLSKRDFQLFMKRLRKHYDDERIRFFACGEYGPRTRRPHYHAILFGVDFPDQRFYKSAKREGENLYWSPALEKLWSYGDNAIGAVTFDSCCYVARYICDKVTGDAAEDHYRKVSPRTGEIVDLEPEFVLMSRRPGIGASYYEKYGKEVYAHDSVVINEREVRPPRYYDVKEELANPVGMQRVKRARVLKAMEPGARFENSPDRRRVREKVVTLNLRRMKEAGDI